MEKSRVELYKAVKYEVVNFVYDHGCNVAQMWAMVNGKHPGYGEKSSNWWKAMCLEDYRTQAKF